MLVASRVMDLPRGVTKEIAELEATIERKRALVSSASLVARLPDKGARILRSIETLQQRLDYLRSLAGNSTAATAASTAPSIHHESNGSRSNDAPSTAMELVRKLEQLAIDDATAAEADRNGSATGDQDHQQRQQQRQYGAADRVPFFYSPSDESRFDLYSWNDLRMMDAAEQRAYRDYMRKKQTYGKLGMKYLHAPRKIVALTDDQQAEIDRSERERARAAAAAAEAAIPTNGGAPSSTSGAFKPTSMNASPWGGIAPPSVIHLWDRVGEDDDDGDDYDGDEHNAHEHDDDDDDDDAGAMIDDGHSDDDAEQ